MEFLTTLLDGYYTNRTLPKLECEHFLPFMPVTLLCNCSWRFIRFNTVAATDEFEDGGDGVDSIREEARNSYLELQRRVEYLHDPVVVQGIRNILERYA